MYPRLDSYMVCIVVGIIVCLWSFMQRCRKLGVDKQMFRSYIILGGFSLAIGAVCSSLLQSLFTSIMTGEPYVPFSSGTTFYGGLLGGATCFVVGGLIFLKGKSRDYFLPVCNIALASVVLAHAFGRIGCFMDGCCYGITTGTFLDMYFPSLAKSVLPTQLYECIFLFALYYVMTKRDVHSLQIYCFGYGAFRFLIEFLRGDIARGEFVPGMSPAQFISILLVVTGVVLTVFWDKISSSSINRVDKVETSQQ